jgi:MFS transporter, SET family, sugar efflux transporter
VSGTPESAPLENAEPLGTGVGPRGESVPVTEVGPGGESAGVTEVGPGGETAVVTEVRPGGESAGVSGLGLVWEVAPLVGGIGACGVVTAFLGSTTSLFLADAVRAGPLLIGLFFAARGAVSIGVGLAAGSLSDRLPDRRLLLQVGGVGGAIGAVCFAVLRNYVAVLVTGAVFFSIGAVSFSQLFAYANDFAHARGRPVTSFTSVVRSVFSASWVIGPPVALFLLTRYGFGPLYLSTAGLCLLTAALGWGLRRLPTRQRPREPRPTSARRGWSAAFLSLPGRTWLLLGAVVALSVVNQMYTIDIALYVTRTLHLGAELVGWIAGLSAALEIPVMIVVGRVAERFGKLHVVLASAAGAAALFFCLLPLARSAAPLLALQVLNATWTAVAMSIPMVLIQEEAPGGAGTGAALYSATFMSASLFAGAITGVTATAIGYGNVFWVCAALSAVAAGMLLVRVTEHRASRETAGDRSG